jgi:hypothetical protein
MPRLPHHRAKGWEVADPLAWEQIPEPSTLLLCIIALWT